MADSLRLMARLLPRTVTLKRLHNIDLILTLTGGLTAALILGYITHRLGLSVFGVTKA